MLIIPHDFQRAAVDSVYKYFETHRVGNPLIALPTGTGKSVVIALLLYEILKKWPHQKILVLTHRKELIQQDYDELKTMWPYAPAGIYSAALGQRLTNQSITFCGIASVYKRAEEFRTVHLVIIDEAHLVSPKDGTMYQTCIDKLKLANPMLRVIGLSATCWRLGHGSLDNNHLFTDICFNMTDMRGFNWLLDKGYMAPVIPLKTQLNINIDGVRTSGGDYVLSDLQKAVDKEDINSKALREMVEYAEHRKHWMVFTTGIEHTEHVNDMLNDYFGISSVAVHSKISNKERDYRLQAYKEGEFQCLVSSNICTTGFNHKPVDFLGILRHSQSSALWVQIVGRGTRIAEGKENCLVADFAKNTERLGPINDPVIPSAPSDKKKKPGVVPIKVCPMCHCYNHTSVRKCDYCGYEFPATLHLTNTSSNVELIKREEKEPIIKEYSIKHITTGIHHKKDRPTSLKVTYYCGLGINVFTEYLGFAHSSAVRNHAIRWWNQRSKRGAPPPIDAEEALARVGELRKPRALLVNVNRKYPEILSHIFE
jgi:DNA repair protein RadD